MSIEDSWVVFEAGKNTQGQLTHEVGSLKDSVRCQNEELHEKVKEMKTMSD